MNQAQEVLTRKNAQHLKKFADLSGQTLRAAVNEALQLWWDTFGEEEILHLQRVAEARRNRNVLQFRPR